MVTVPILVAIASRLVAAQTPDSPSAPTIRVTTKLVQINVVVHDKQDHPIIGLHKQDFNVFDNGKPQPIAVFVEETADGAHQRVLPENSFSNRFAEENGARSGYAVILLDWLNTEWSDQARARNLVIRMLETIDPSDKIALCTLGSQLRIIHGFDSPTSELMAKLGRLRGESSAAAGAASSSFAYDASNGEIARNLFPPPGAGGAVGRGTGRLGADQQIAALDKRVRDTVQALSEIAGYLAGVPGRKCIVWVTAGFPNLVDSRVIPGAKFGERSYAGEIDRAIRKLNEADVAVYPVDARGLSLGNPYLTIPTMEEFAARTGGKGYFNRNDLDKGLREALNDQLTSYTLGYYAPSAENQSALHRIQVQVKRSGVTVRHRTSYFPDDAGSTGAEALKTIANGALLSPVDATAIALDAHAARRLGSLEMRLTVAADKLEWTQQSDHWDSEIQVLMRFSSDVGAQAGEISAKQIGIKMPREDYLRTLSSGLLLEKTLQIPASAASLRILVLDSRSGKRGTLTIPLRKIRDN